MTVSVETLDGVVGRGRPVPDLAARFDEELEPHFRLEEELLLPGLSAAGRHALVARTLGEHAELRRLRDAPDGHRELGRRLREHVRFEERELFAVCEAELDDAVLDTLAERARGRRPPDD